MPPDLSRLFDTQVGTPIVEANYAARIGGGGATSSFSHAQRPKPNHYPKAIIFTESLAEQRTEAFAAWLADNLDESYTFSPPPPTATFATMFATEPPVYTEDMLKQNGTMLMALAVELVKQLNEGLPPEARALDPRAAQEFPRRKTDFDVDGESIGFAFFNDFDGRSGDRITLVVEAQPPSASHVPPRPPAQGVGLLRRAVGWVAARKVTTLSELERARDPKLYSLLLKMCVALVTFDASFGVYWDYLSWVFARRVTISSEPGDFFLLLSPLFPVTGSRPSLTGLLTSTFFDTVPDDASILAQAQEVVAAHPVTGATSLTGGQERVVQATRRSARVQKHESQQKDTAGSTSRGAAGPVSADAAVQVSGKSAAQNMDDGELQEMYKILKSTPLELASFLSIFFPDSICPDCNEYYRAPLDGLPTLSMSSLTSAETAPSPPSVSSPSPSLPVSSAPHGEASLPLALELHDEIGRGADAIAFSASLRGQELVVKMALAPDKAPKLKHGAAIQVSLSDVAPAILGLFESADLDHPIAIIEENAGTNLREWDDLELEEKNHFYAMLLAIHMKHHIHHGDVGPRNVLVAPSESPHGTRRIRITDFAHAERGHDCNGEDCGELRDLHFALFGDAEC